MAPDEFLKFRKYPQREDDATGRDALSSRNGSEKEIAILRSSNGFKISRLFKMFGEIVWMRIVNRFVLNWGEPILEQLPPPLAQGWRAFSKDINQVTLMMWQADTRAMYLRAVKKSSIA